MSAFPEEKFVPDLPELHLFLIIVGRGYLFTKYKSGVLGDNGTKDPLWWLGANSALCALLQPHPIKRSHRSHEAL